jgi:hypothetical protein
MLLFVLFLLFFYVLALPLPLVHFFLCSSARQGTGGQRGGGADGQGGGAYAVWQYATQSATVALHCRWSTVVGPLAALRLVL